MNILGISAFYHDSAAALIADNQLLAAAQEERFSRKKNDASFPTNAVRFCLKTSDLTISDLDAIVFYEKPLLKFERLLENYYAFAPRGLVSFVSAMPIWLREKLFYRKQFYRALSQIEKYDKRKVKILFSEHHLSHAAGAFYPSGFDKAAILTVDGMGEWTSASIALGEGNQIKILKELRYPHSLGLFYSAFTYFLGFEVNSGEYKVMGLAPYGNIDSENFRRFSQIIQDNLLEISEDGSIWLNQKYFAYTTQLRMIREKKWEKIFGFPARKPTSALEQEHCDLALVIQKITEEVMLKMAIEAKRITQAQNLCLAGGVALNCVANTKILKEKLFEKIYIQPAAGDAGGALGAALAVNYLYFQQKHNLGSAAKDWMQGSYLGPEFKDFEIEKILSEAKAVYQKFAGFDKLIEKTAELLAEGNVVAWFQGRMEFGPRALGNRSILADARNPEIQKKLNLKIKNRESFRPFAPSVLGEEANKYLDLSDDSPFMLLTAEIKENRKKTLPKNYPDFSMEDKLNFIKSDIPAVTHVDFSARLQTVHQETNPKFWKLIKRFEEISGYALLVNTSFNVRDEPIVCSPEDALFCFKQTAMDYLVIGNFLLDKKQLEN